MQQDELYSAGKRAIEPDREYSALIRGGSDIAPAVVDTIGYSTEACILRAPFQAREGVLRLSVAVPYGRPLAYNFTLVVASRYLGSIQSGKAVDGADA